MELCKYVNDRVELIQQVFLTMKSSKIKAMVPECLRSCELKEIKELLLEELLGISRKRLISIIKGAECPSNTESSDSDDSDVEVIDTVSIGELSDDGEDQDNDIEMNEENGDNAQDNNIEFIRDDDIFIISDTDSSGSKKVTTASENSDDSISTSSIISHVTLNSDISHEDDTSRITLEDKSNLESDSPIVLSDSEDSRTGETLQKENIENEREKEENSDWTSRWLSSSKMKRVLITSKIYNDIRKKKKREKELSQTKGADSNVISSEINKNETSIVPVTIELEGSVTEYNNLLK